MLIAGIALSLAFAAIKALGPYIPTQQIMFFRMTFGLVPLLPLIMAAGPRILLTERPKAHAYRVGAGFISMALLFWAVPRLPLADAVTTQFTMPLFLTLLSGVDYLFRGSFLRTSAD